MDILFIFSFNFTFPQTEFRVFFNLIIKHHLCDSGKLSWEQVLKYASLRKRYISLYASLLKSDPSRAVVEDNKDIEELDRGLDIELILQWRYCFCWKMHLFVIIIFYFGEKQTIINTKEEIHLNE